MIYDIAILGAGASGLMAASFLKDRSVCIIDSNSYIGAKIKVSGGAKCNITNKYMNSSYYLGDQDLIQSTLKNFSQKELLNFLNQNSIYPKLDEKIVKGTFFCASSKDVNDMFKKLTYHCKYKLNTNILDIEYKDNLFKIITSKGSIIAKKVIVATGGLSYSSLGASDIGYKIAQKFGHTIKRCDPALVGFTVQKDQFWFKKLSGLSLDVAIKVDNKTIEGKMLFTHKGCSGPVILTSSLYWSRGSFSIDFSPYKNSYLPKRFRQAIKEISNFDIHNYTMSPAGTFGFSKAEVTKGGVATNEISKTFESKLQKNLYFIGEVLDITGQLGGYNFQWCFSSAVTCAKVI